MAKKTSAPSNSKSLDLSGLKGDISFPIIDKDDYFGLDKDIWSAAERLSAQLPIDIRVQGDLTSEEVNLAIEQAKGSEIQANFWKEYDSAISTYLKNYKKILESRKAIASNVSNTRLSQVQLEKELGIELVSLEQQVRKIKGEYLSSKATTSIKLEANLDNIVERFTEAAAKAAIPTGEEKQPTEFSLETKSLLQAFRERRGARFSDPGSGITQRIRGSK